MKVYHLENTTAGVHWYYSNLKTLIEDDNNGFDMDYVHVSRTAKAEGYPFIRGEWVIRKGVIQKASYKKSEG